MSTKYNNEKLVAVGQLKKAIQDYDDSFEKVAVTGSYNDLKDTPNLHKVATSGKYSDLTGRPTKVSQFTNDANYQTATQVDDKIAAQVAKVYRPKGSVANYESLPTSTAQEGDVYNLLDTDMNYAFTADGTWDPLATTVDLSGLVKEEDLADVATSGSYNDLKDTPALPDGSLWGESASKGVYYPKTADIGNLGQDTVYVGDKAKDTAPKATRSLISISGVGTTLGISNPAGTTAYKMSDTYDNRIMASVLASGGFVALNETNAKTKTASVVSVKMQDGSDLTPGHADSYGGTSNPIVITVNETVNPDAATSSLRFYGRFSNNNYLIAGMGVSATGNGKCIISGQHIGNAGGTSLIAGNTIYNKGSRSCITGQNIVNKQDSVAVHGVGHDTTNGSEGMAVFGKYSDLSDPNTYFAVGNGSSDTSRSNLFALSKTGDIFINNAKQEYVKKLNDLDDVVVIPINDVINNGPSVIEDNLGARLVILDYYGRYIIIQDELYSDDTNTIFSIADGLYVLNVQKASDNRYFVSSEYRQILIHVKNRDIININDYSFRRPVGIMGIDTNSDAVANAYILAASVGAEDPHEYAIRATSTAPLGTDHEIIVLLDFR